MGTTMATTTVRAIVMMMATVRGDGDGVCHACSNVMQKKRLRIKLHAMKMEYGSNINEV